jgi:hypothetical protein
MAGYDQFLAYGFAIGVWRGLFEADGQIEHWFDVDAKPQPQLELLELYPWIRPAAVGVWLATAAYLSHTFRGFLYIAGLPLGLYLIGKVLVASGARWALEIAHRCKLNEQRTRRWLTVIGVTLAIAACVPTFVTDPCSDPDVYCD